MRVMIPKGVVWSEIKFGGGDPDRTGDPRLMSPLLCQLSYTASIWLLPEGTKYYLRKGGGVYWSV